MEHRRRMVRACLGGRRRLGSRHGHGIGIQGDLQAAVERGEDGGRLGGARVLGPQREQVMDVLGLEKALLLGVSQHLRSHSV